MGNVNFFFCKREQEGNMKLKISLREQLSRCEKINKITQTSEKKQTRGEGELVS